VIDWSSIPFVKKFISKERVVMSITNAIESLKDTISEALESGISVRDEAEDRAQKLNEIVSELETINSDLEDNQSTLDNIEENLNALDEQKNLADDLGITT